MRIGAYMTPLTEKRLRTVLDKADHRWAWYKGAYPDKARKEPAEASKRWWEALVGAVQRFDFTTQEVIDRIAIDKDSGDFSTEWEALGPYAPRALKRWGVKA